MAPSIPTSEPSLIVAGDTAKWTMSFADYPVTDAWALTYHLRGASALDVAAQAQTADFLVTVTAAASAKLKPGRYTWIARVTKAGESYAARRGTLTVLPDAAQAEAGDLQTFAEKLLALTEQEIQNRMTGQRSIEQYSIAGRSFAKITVTELSRLRAQYRAEVAAERRPGKLGIPVGAVFARPS